ncbi:MAG: hypothetical protein K6G54_00275, partial [Oscillospiraceae bacterium]|nr:hypothetical protein [Oscillospiraceae bacterium]
MNQFRTHPSLRRLLALMLSLAMALSLPAGVASAADSAAADPNVLEASTLDAFTAGAKADGDSTAAGEFTLLWSAKSKVDSSNKTWDDGYASSQRINFGGKASLEMNAIRFDTAGDATVKVWWVSGGDDRQIVILDSSGATAAVTEAASVKNTAYCSELTLSGAGTYYLGGDTGSNYIFKVEVTTGAAEKPPRADWSTVSAPVITSVESGEEITLTVNALVGYDGADKLNVTVTDADGKAVTVLSSGRMQEQHTLTYAPTASGTYHFSAALSRAEEEDIVGAETKSCDYVLPLGIPGIKYVANVGGGSLAAEWEPVPEADGYLVTVKDTDYRQTVTGTTATIEGLTVGQSYTVMVAALRGEETG